MGTVAEANGADHSTSSETWKKRPGGGPAELGTNESCAL